MEQIRLLNTIPEVFAGHAPTCPVSDVWGCDLSFDKGKSYLVRADSGRGKSSLCSFLYGLRSDYCGDIFFDGQKIAGSGDEKWDAIRQRSLGILFQDLRLFGDLTAVENVMLKASLSGYCDEGHVVGRLTEIGLSDRLDLPVRLLSFGQQQRVAFVRMLCQEADFLVLDEPVSHLDASNAEVMSRMLKRKVEECGAGVIVTTIGHDLPYDYDKILML